MTHLESLNVYVLFLFKIMKETNFNLVFVCVVFLGMKLVKKVIGVMIPLANIFGFLDMWSFGNTKCFTPPLVYESPPSIYDVSSHASDELPKPIIDVPTDNALAVDPFGPFDSHALRRSCNAPKIP